MSTGDLSQLNSPNGNGKASAGNVEVTGVLQDVEAERAVIALAFRDLQHYTDLVQAGVIPEMFHDKSPARWLWAAFTQAYQPPAVELVLDDLLKAMEKQLSAGRREACEKYLDEATSRYVSEGRLDDYRNRLVKAYQRRLSVKGANLWQNRSADPDADPEKVLAEVEDIIGQIRLARTPLEVLSAQVIAEARREWYEERLRTGADASRIPFEITSLNRATKGGFKRKEFTVVSAKPRIGKSAFLQREAFWRAVHQEQPVLYVSVEMDADHWVDRALTQETGIPSYLLETGEFRTHPDLVFSNLHRFGKSPLYLIDDPNATTETIKRGCEHVLRRAGDLVAVYVDYAQRLGDRKNFAGRVHDFIQHVSAELAAIPRIYNCHLFAISRIKGDGETYGGMQLDYDVDNWIELRNDLAVQELPEQQKSGPALAFFKKQRYNPSGIAAPLYWNADWVRFSDPNSPLQALEWRYDRY